MKKYCIALITLLSLSTIAAAQAPQPSLAGVLKNVMPSIVDVRALGTAPTMDGSEKPTDQKFISLGSGVIIKTDNNNAYIVTNSHVIANTSAMTVTLQDGETFTAHKVGDAPEFDLAVLKINNSSEQLKPLPFSNSNNLQIGDSVAAIGNPFDLQETVTSGIVSGINRNQPGLDKLTNYIQTDAAINQGNSGGALINMNGQLVGINTWIVSKDGGNLGIGFAIPSNIVKLASEQLIQYGNVQRGQLGVMVQDMTPELAKGFGIPFIKGAIITTINPGTPAEKDGLQVGDIITAVGGETVDSNSEAVALVSLHRPGEPFVLTVNRNGKEKTFNTSTITPGSLPKKDPYLFGVTLENITTRTIGQGQQTTGVLVVNTSPKTDAENAGLLQGDVITQVNGNNVTDIEQLRSIVKENKSNPLLLTVRRGAGNLFITIRRDQPDLELGTAP